MLFNKFKVDEVRDDFPVVQGDFVYLDTACMSLKPKQVVEKMNSYYSDYSACAGRSAHSPAEKVDAEVSKARREVKKLINASSPEEIVFLRNTTEGINLVANSLGFEEGDEVIISDKEHNSNLVPWLKLEEERGVEVKVVESREDNTFSLENYKEAFSKNTKLVSVVHTSNMDGVSNPIEKIVSIAHEKGVEVLVDGAQSVPHQKVDVKKLGVDYLVFSGHKMLGPTGVGVLYGKKSSLERLDQFLVGGSTVMNSEYDSYVEEEIPMKFEAGLQDYSGIIGFGEACRYIKKVKYRNIKKQVLKLNKIITEGLLKHEEIELIGPEDPEMRSGIFSFNIKGINPHEVAEMLDSGANIAVRAGAHCVHSWFNARDMKGSVRASFYFYNTKEEAEKFVEEVEKVIELSR